jgi:hypothetical protein
LKPSRALQNVRDVGHGLFVLAVFAIGWLLLTIAQAGG